MSSLTMYLPFLGIRICIKCPLPGQVGHFYQNSISISAVPALLASARPNQTLTPIRLTNHQSQYHHLNLRKAQPHLISYLSSKPGIPILMSYLGIPILTGLWVWPTTTSMQRTTFSNVCFARPNPDSPLKI